MTEFEELLREVLEEGASVVARDGLEGRVLARVGAAPRRRVGGVGRWRPVAVLMVVMVLVAAGYLDRMATTGRDGTGSTAPGMKAERRGAGTAVPEEGGAVPVAGVRLQRREGRRADRMRRVRTRVGFWEEADQAEVSALEVVPLRVVPLAVMPPGGD